MKPKTECAKSKAGRPARSGRSAFRASAKGVREFASSSPVAKILANKTVMVDGGSYFHGGKAIDAGTSVKRLAADETESGRVELFMAPKGPLFDSVKQGVPLEIDGVSTLLPLPYEVEKQ